MAQSPLTQSHKHVDKEIGIDLDQSFMND